MYGLRANCKPCYVLQQCMPWKLDTVSSFCHFEIRIHSNLSWFEIFVHIGNALSWLSNFKTKGFLRCLHHHQCKRLCVLLSWLSLNFIHKRMKGPKKIITIYCILSLIFEMLNFNVYSNCWKRKKIEFIPKLYKMNIKMNYPEISLCFKLLVFRNSATKFNVIWVVDISQNTMENKVKCKSGWGLSTNCYK